MAKRRTPTPDTCLGFLQQCFIDTIKYGRVAYSTYKQFPSYNYCGIAARNLGFLKFKNPEVTSGGLLLWAHGLTEPTIHDAEKVCDAANAYADSVYARRVERDKSVPVAPETPEIDEYNDSDEPSVLEVLQAMAMTQETLLDRIEALVIENKQINVKMDAWKDQ